MTTIDMTPDTTLKTAPARRAPNWFVAAAWSIPALIAADLLGGDFGWLAIAPAVAMLVAALRDPAVGALRWWTGLTTAMLAVPLFYDGDTGAGFMQDMHPAVLAVLIGSAAVVLAKIYRSHR